MVESKQRKLPGRPYHPRVPLFPAGDLLGAEEGGASVRIEKAREEIEARGRAVSLALVHRGVDEPVEAFNAITAPAAGALTTLVSFTVPQGMVGKFDRFGIVYSEPIVAANNAVGWRISINGGEVPYVRTNFPLFGYYQMCLGDMLTPWEIEPLWVQAAETIAIELWAVAGFVDYLVVLGRIGGRLYKPASPDIVGAENRL